MMTQLLFMFLQGSAYPVFGGDEPLTPTSQVVLRHTVLQYMQHDILQQICCDVDYQLLCSWDHPAALVVAKMAHHTRLT